MLNSCDLFKFLCLLNTGTFECICLFWELNTYLLNTGCLLNGGGH